MPERVEAILKRGVVLRSMVAYWRGHKEGQCRGFGMDDADE